MKMEITREEFKNELERVGRDKRFSPAGLSALYDYLVELEESTGEEVEPDVGFDELCGGFTEYENFNSVQQEFDYFKTLEELEEQATVIKLGNGGLIVFTLYLPLYY